MKKKFWKTFWALFCSSEASDLLVCCKSTDLLCHSLTEWSSLSSVVTIKGIHAKDVVLLKGEGSCKKLSLFCASWKAEGKDGVATQGTASTCGLVWASALAGALMEWGTEWCSQKHFACIFSYLNNAGDLSHRHQNILLYLHALKAAFLLNSFQALNKREKQKWNQHLLPLPTAHSLRGIYTAWGMSPSQPH